MSLTWQPINVPQGLLSLFHNAITCTNSTTRYLCELAARVTKPGTLTTNEMLVVQEDLLVEGQLSAFQHVQGQGLRQSEQV